MQARRGVREGESRGLGGGRLETVNNGFRPFSFFFLGGGVKGVEG